MRNSLFLKIYLTLIASLAVVAVASAIFVRIGQDERDTGWRDRRGQFVAAMLPADANRARLQATIERLADAVEADIALYGADGRLVAGVGQPFPDEVLRRRGLGPRRDAHTIVMQLNDGRQVAVRTRAPIRRGRRPLAYLAMIAGVIGLAAYPVVRHLTRRLERLRLGVEAWGEGALVTRVPDHGSDEVAAVAKSFNRAADQIERLIRSHRALLANASHELRSPLARLRMAIDLYDESPDPRRKEEIVRNLGELDQLVDEILLASRLDHVGKLELSETIDLLALVTEECARHGIEASGNTVTISGDPRLVTRLVRNLVQNANKHGTPPVEVTISRENTLARLSVRDHGVGVPEAEAARVFEPFYRPTGRSEAAGGWGLGLALVRQIAERHGGAVRYRSPPGGGAEFIVEFPVAQSG